MKKIIFVTGGNRSGKSDFAQKKAENFHGIRTYIATAIAFDEEMKKRIALHKRKRDKDLWHNLVEEPYKLPDIIQKLNRKTDVVLVDCITIWLSNLLLKYEENIKFINSQIDLLIDSLKKIDYNIVLVSNEVGMGIVPENKLARFFRDISGIANQKLADIADEFFVVFSGYSLKLK